MLKEFGIVQNWEFIVLFYEGGGGGRRRHDNIETEISDEDGDETKRNWHTASEISRNGGPLLQIVKYD